MTSPAAAAATTAVPRPGFLGGALWSLSGRGVALLTGTVSSMLLARLLPPEQLGAYFLLFTLVAAAALLGQLGLSGVVVRLVSQALATGRPGRARHAATCVLALGLGGAIAAALLLVLLRPWLLAHAFAAPGMALGLTLAAAWVVVLALQNLLTETFRGFHDFRRATLTGSIHGGLLLCAALLAAYAAGIDLHLHEVVALQTAAAGIAVLLGLVAMAALLRRLPRATGSLRPVAMLAAPFLGTAALFFVLAQADLWIIGCLRPKADVALYGAAARLAALANMPLLIVNTVVAPTIAALHAGGRTAQLQRVLRASAALAFAPTLLAGAAFVLAGGPALELVFGPYYRGAAPILSVLALAQLVNAFAGSCGLTLMMTGHQRPMLLLTAAVGITTIAAAAAVAPAAGPFGVALVMLVSQLLHNAGMWWLARRRVGVCTHADVFAAPGASLRVLRQTA